MDLLAGSDCEVEEFQLSSDPEALGALNGASLGELQLGRRTGALVLAIRPPRDSRGPVLQYRGAPVATESNGLIANPGGHERLAPGQLLVVLGSKHQLQQLQELLGPALLSVGQMAT
jgi:voltage-gated potassium channel